MRSQPLKTWTVEEYLAFERTSEIRHEYVDGEVFAMSGATRRHGRIVGNLFLSIAPAARRKGCEAQSQGTQTHIRNLRTERYYYPDLVVTCDAADDDVYAINRACLIVEVLSPTTRAIDLREKKQAYLSLPSLRQYLLVDPEGPGLTSFRRTAQGWVEEELAPGDRLDIECIDAEIGFEDITADTTD